MTVRIKICGITCVEDALYAAQCGVDAIGLVFVERSPRYVTVARAASIVAALPPFVTTVGLFVDAPEQLITHVLDAMPLDTLQFHGNESPQQCRIYGRSYLKAIRMKDDIDLQQQAERYADASGLLLDTYHPGVAGGTGEAFDWTRVPKTLKKPIILAGGLTPENVGAAIRATSPYAVDVSSGVEESKGVKSPSMVRTFIEQVKTASQ